MSTVADIVTRVTDEWNDAGNIFWTPAIALNCVAEGFTELHARMKARLQGQLPDLKRSVYWRPFLKSTTIALANGVSEYALPADFDFLLNLMDAATNENLSYYDIQDEKVMARGNRLGVNQGNGYYTFVPSAKIRVMVWPGQEGLPSEARNLTIRYFQSMPRYTASGTTIFLADEHTTPVVHYAVAKGFIRERESPVEKMQQFDAAIEAIV